MFFMVIEHFKNGDPKPIQEKLLHEGQMMPVDLVYHSSWVDPVNARCFQLMETEEIEYLRRWMSSWEELIDFEIIPVIDSKEYWEVIGKKKTPKKKKSAAQS